LQDVRCQALALDIGYQQNALAFVHAIAPANDNEVPAQERLRHC
jgi:hypothetical protein